MNEEYFSEQMLRFTQGRCWCGESASERVDAVMGIQTREWQPIADVIQQKRPLGRTPSER